jgi:two-component system sensor histidine kinase KdpD
MDATADRDGRPSPDALLAQAGRDGRGRLKVFLGAAPGVGKTYEMLQSAHARAREGVDVVVGVVETHGRRETMAQLEGLETVPSAQVEYKGRMLPEMDLDAVLRRRPALVLVDEFAHTNAPGSRHPKRYLDVEELLDAGIDVYTTLNIQHLESLNDIVARITRVRVRETVPDSVIDRADDVEVVDLSPQDLIQRLQDGKVYVPEQAERAIRHYFTQGNLTALRELALRRTAQRVSDQVVSYMQAHAIPGPWATGDRVLVVVGDGPEGDEAVRYGRQFAERLHAPWAAIHIETARSHRLPEARRDRIADSLRLAQRLGGDAVTIPAADLAAGVIDYARTNNFTQLVIARPQRRRWYDLFRRTDLDRLLAAAGDLAVHAIPTPGEAEVASPERQVAADPRAYAGSAAAVAVAVAVGLGLRQFLAVSNVSLAFLTAVLVAAVAYGLWPALFAGFVGALAYNFFFLEPLYTFTITDPENIVALFFFAVVAVIAGNLAARVRDQAMAARARALTADNLYQFSRKLAVAATLDDLLWAVAYQIALMLKMRVVILLPEGETVAVRAGYPPEDMLDDADIAAAIWCWRNNQPAGRGADTLPGARRLFLPMRTARGAVGVVGLDSDRPGPLLSPDQRRLLDALIDQAALGIDRVNLAQDVDRARMTAETERLRSALLTSISHDLRTPLASILGSATSLAAYHGVLAEPDRVALIGTIQEEAERLNRFIANLLDMTRLESGAIAPKTSAVDLADVAGSALGRAAKVLGDRPVALDLPATLPLVQVDPVLLEQVLFNLLDNAAKYAPAGSAIRLEAEAWGHVVRLRVMDEGEGIPPDDVERIFDKFYRIRAADRQRAGTGLGLAIARGFVEVMGGTIVAGNRTDRTGAVFTLSLPAADIEAEYPE